MFDPGIQISEMPLAPNTHPLTNLDNACGQRGKSHVKSMVDINAVR